MAVIWEAIDRLGRPVVLTEAGWAHILDRHKDMVPHLLSIRDAISHADEVTVDAVYSRRNVHYLRSTPTTIAIRVAVNYKPAEPSGWAGEIITALRSERKKQGERRLWP